MKLLYLKHLFLYVEMNLEMDEMYNIGMYVYWKFVSVQI